MSLNHASVASNPSQRIDNSKIGQESTASCLLDGTIWKDVCWPWLKKDDHHKHPDRKKMTTTSTTTTMANSITSRCTTRLYYDLLTTPKPYRSPKKTDQTKPKSICLSLVFSFFEGQNLFTCQKYFCVHCWDISCEAQYNLIQYFLYSNILLRLYQK